MRIAKVALTTKYAIWAFAAYVVVQLGLGSAIFFERQMGLLGSAKTAKLLNNRSNVVKLRGLRRRTTTRNRRDELAGIEELHGCQKGCG